MQIPQSCQRVFYRMTWLYENSRHTVKNFHLLQRSLSTKTYGKKEQQNNVSAKLPENNALQIDEPKPVFQKQESSQPDIDVQRITPESRGYELKADDMFDELAALRGANRQTFLMAVNSYISKENLYRRGAVEFIYAALQRMKFFGVEKDVTAYKALIKVFPEGKMIPSNVFQVEFMHYPRQQNCGVDLLEQMERNFIIPDDEFGTLLKNRFGISAHVTRKYRRMMYWMPKFKNANPYPVPWKFPDDPVELALMALKRMCVDLHTKYNIYKTSELNVASDEDTFIASAQSPVQQHLISKHKSDQPLFVEGPYPVYMRHVHQKYFLLRDEPDVNNLMKERQRHLDEENDNKLFEWTSYFEEEQCEEIKPVLTVHEQEDSTILGLCITGTGTKSSVITWIRCLEQHNPNLAKTPVIFKLLSSNGEIEAVGDNRPYRKLLK